MFRTILFTLCALSAAPVYAQQPAEVYKNPADHGENYYIKFEPKGSPKGMLVLIARTLSDSSMHYAREQGLLVLDVVPLKATQNIELMTSPDLSPRMDAMIAEVAKAHKVPAGKIVVGGMSAAGTAALRYAAYCGAGKSAGKVELAGVFGVDPPLDYERMFDAYTHALARNFSVPAVNEANAVTGILRATYGGSPDEQRTAYQAASPYSHAAKDGGPNVAPLNNMAVRIYSEPDINWWIENRRQDLYEMNILDDAALIDQLRVNGNQQTSLILTENKGYRGDGSRHPHSWTIVDEKGLLDWCLEVCAAKK